MRNLNKHDNWRLEVSPWQECPVRPVSQLNTHHWLRPICKSRNAEKLQLSHPEISTSKDNINIIAEWGGVVTKGGGTLQENGLDVPLHFEVFTLSWSWSWLPTCVIWPPLYFLRGGGCGGVNRWIWVSR